MTGGEQKGPHHPGLVWKQWQLFLRLKNCPLPSLALPASFVMNTTWQSILKELMLRAKQLYNPEGFQGAVGGVP